MKARSLSITIGKGSVSHNTRSFIANNVDANRTKDIITFIHQDIKQAYHHLFDETLKNYNSIQKRKDRIIKDYYEKIRTGKQEKTFHEIIVQIGNKDTMNAKSSDGKLAKEILVQYMNEFIKRNNSLYVFSAHLHMDEETPHLHIDFIPYTTGSKRGLETRVSLKQALNKLGFISNGKYETEFLLWKQSEEEALARVMKAYDIEWEKLGTHNEHLSVYNYKKQERIKEVKSLEKHVDQLSKKLDSYKKDVDEAEMISKEVSHDIWMIPEPKRFMSASSYKKDIVDVFIQKLKSIVFRIVNNYIELMQEVKQLRSTILPLKIKINDQEKIISKLINENRTASKKLRRFQKALGYKTYDEILNGSKEKKKNVREI